MNVDAGRTDQPATPAGPGIRLVRLRLALALLAAAIVPLAVGAPLLVRAGLDLQPRLGPAEAAAIGDRLSRDLGSISAGLTGLAVDADVQNAADGDARAAKEARGDVGRFFASLPDIVVGVWVLDADANSAVAGRGTLPAAAGPIVAGVMPRTAGTLVRADLLAGVKPTNLGSDFMLATPIRARTDGAPSKGIVLIRVALDALMLDATVGFGADAKVVAPAGSSLPPPTAPAGAKPQMSSSGQRIQLDAAGFDGWAVDIVPRSTGFEISPGWFLLALGFGAVVAVIVWWLFRQVVRPAQQLEQASERLAEMYRSARIDALEDSLTGLGNHRAFMEEFDRQLEAARRYNVSLSLLLVDLDDFKLVNDSAGHAVGDELLMEVGRLLRSTLRRADRPFRIGGDEFAILMPHTDPQNAELVSRRLLAQCVEPRPGSSFPRPFSFSGGISSAPEFGRTRTEVFGQADSALYRAKHGGRTSVEVFDPALVRPSLDEHTLSTLSAAVSRVVAVGALRPVYQPIVDVRNGRVVGFEGLIRPDPDSGFRNAGELFAAAETSGRTLDLDRACLEAVIRGAREIAPDQSLSLNVSPRSLEAPEFSPSSLLALLRHHGLDASRITLELTEREAVDDVERLRHVLAACQAAGLRIAADDIGAGNAGLRLLSQIHFDIVKIDLSLVHDGARNESSLEVMRALAELAHRWGAMVVAEGVETPGQLRIVQSLDVGAAQGYLLGRPTDVPTARQVDLGSLLASEGGLGLRAAFAGAVAGSRG